MTNQELIDQALQALGYIEYGASADATDSADALDVANQMLHAWKYASKDLNWGTQVTLGDTAPIPDWAEEAVINNLGLKCATRFNVAPTAMLIADAREGAKLIERTLINQALDNVDNRHLHQGAGQRARYDIETDLF